MERLVIARYLTPSSESLRGEVKLEAINKAYPASVLGRVHVEQRY